MKAENSKKVIHLCATIGVLAAIDDRPDRTNHQCGLAEVHADCLAQ
jgi:hypothetical protein